MAEGGMKGETIVKPKLINTSNGIQRGWPEEAKKVPIKEVHYWSRRGLLTLNNGLL